MGVRYLIILFIWMLFGCDSNSEQTSVLQSRSAKSGSSADDETHGRKGESRTGDDSEGVSGYIVPKHQIAATVGNASVTITASAGTVVMAAGSAADIKNLWVRVYEVPVNDTLRNALNSDEASIVIKGSFKTAWPVDKSGAFTGSFASPPDANKTLVLEVASDKAAPKASEIKLQADKIGTSGIIYDAAFDAYVNQYGIPESPFFYQPPNGNSGGGGSASLIANDVREFRLVNFNGATYALLHTTVGGDLLLKKVGDPAPAITVDAAAVNGYRSLSMCATATRISVAYIDIGLNSDTVVQSECSVYSCRRATAYSLNNTKFNDAQVNCSQSKRILSFVGDGDLRSMETEGSIADPELRITNELPVRSGNDSSDYTLGYNLPIGHDVVLAKLASSLGEIAVFENSSGAWAKTKSLELDNLESLLSPIVLYSSDGLPGLLWINNNVVKYSGHLGADWANPISINGPNTSLQVVTHLSADMNADDQTVSVWFETDPTSTKVYVARLKNGTWSPKVELTEKTNGEDLFWTASLATEQSTHLYAFWAETTGVYGSHFDEAQGKWINFKLSGDLASNAPIQVIETPQGKPLVTWTTESSLYYIVVE